MHEQPETSLVLVVQMGSERVARELSDSETLIGRTADCQIQVPLPQVSGKHARIVKDGDQYFLEDLGSRNGTFVNGQRISTRVSLSSGDVVMLGQEVRLDVLTQPTNAAAADQVRLAVPPVTLVSDETQLDIRGTIKRSTRFGLLDADPEAKLNAVLEIGTALAGQIDLPALCTKILDTIFHILPLADRGCIMLKDRASGELVPRAVKFRDEDSEDSLRLSRTIVNRVLAEKTGVFSVDATTDSQFDDKKSIADLKIRSMMCVPIMDLAGEASGIISVDSQSHFGEFKRNDLELLTAMAGQASLLYENVRLLENYIEQQRQVRVLERKQQELSQFFSPKVLETFALEDAESVLQPRVAEVTVLFCDIRGFTLRSERSRDSLPNLLGRCTQALELMTHFILEHGGVIADFFGDSALGFWGWPTAQASGPLAACRAALDIERAFADERRGPGSKLKDFHVGIGIAHGNAIAGRIGTEQHRKIGVFGPVVNLGSRLEGMTKYFRTPIVIDEQTAGLVRRDMPLFNGRCRRLGRVVPYGMANPLSIFQLLPQAGEYSTVPDKDIAVFESAVDAATAGDWSKSFELLDSLPVEDRAKDFLMSFMALHDYKPPADWMGVFQMTTK